MISVDFIHHNAVIYNFEEIAAFIESRLNVFFMRKIKIKTGNTDSECFEF